jgi:hypothetical protein
MGDFLCQPLREALERRLHRAGIVHTHILSALARRAIAAQLMLMMAPLPRRIMSFTLLRQHERPYIDCEGANQRLICISVIGWWWWAPRCCRYQSPASRRLHRAMQSSSSGTLAATALTTAFARISSTVRFIPSGMIAFVGARGTHHPGASRQTAVAWRAAACAGDDGNFAVEQTHCLPPIL